MIPNLLDNLFFLFILRLTLLELQWVALLLLSLKWLLIREDLPSFYKILWLINGKIALQVCNFLLLFWSDLSCWKLAHLFHFFRSFKELLQIRNILITRSIKHSLEIRDIIIFRSLEHSLKVWNIIVFGSPEYLLKVRNLLKFGCLGHFLLALFLLITLVLLYLLKCLFFRLTRCLK